MKKPQRLGRATSTTHSRYRIAHSGYRIGPETTPIHGLLLLLLIVGRVRCASAETVLDASRQWREHASTAPISASPAPAPAAPVAEAETPGACECEPLSTPDKLEQATYAFTGQVLEANKPKKATRTLVFGVDEIFKGTPKEEMEVVAEVTGDACDLPFEEGQTYLVFARWAWGRAVTSRCMGTKLVEKAKEEGLGPSQTLKEKIYLHLRDACMGRADTVCCLSSLKAMGASYGLPEPQGGCPSGMIPDRLRCAGSYTWCIPLNEKVHR